MIPIKNKKKTLEVTVEEMRNFAFNYIEKFAPSKQQLKTIKRYCRKEHYEKAVKSYISKSYTNRALDYNNYRKLYNNSTITNNNFKESLLNHSKYTQQGTIEKLKKFALDLS